MPDSIRAGCDRGELRRSGILIHRGRWRRGGRGEQALREPTLEHLQHECGARGFARRIGDARAERREVLPIADEPERARFERWHHALEHALFVAVDEKRRWRRPNCGERDVRRPGLAHAVHRPVERKEPMRRDKHEPKAGPVLGTDPRERRPVERDGVRRVENVAPRPLERREIRGKGPAPRERLGDWPREKLGKALTREAEREAPRRVRHQIELREIVEGVVADRGVERAVVFAQDAVDAREVGVPVDVQALLCRNSTIRAEPRDDTYSVPVVSIERRDKTCEVVLHDGERVRPGHPFPRFSRTTRPRISLARAASAASRANGGMQSSHSISVDTGPSLRIARS